MPIVEFPSPEEATEDGIVAIGGDLHEDSLLLAYSQGIFPWPVEVDKKMILAWFCPENRAVIFLDELKIPRSLEKARRKFEKDGYTFTFDKDFSTVIHNCSSVKRMDAHGKTQGTWITEDMREAYIHMASLGYAHSVECWKDQKLVGGLYGTYVKGIFAGESMFHKEPNASKLCFLFLAEHLKAKGASLVDIQMMTPHFEALGAREIPRREFLKLLKVEQGRRLQLF